MPAAPALNRGPPRTASLRAFLLPAIRRSGGDPLQT